MNYKIEAFDILLNKDCILQRYYPLIPYKKLLIENLQKINCFTKNECVVLSDETLLDIGLVNIEMVNLFRRFLSMYDVKNSKFKGIEDNTTSKKQADSFRELYHLPGVSFVRAKLYYEAGYDSLSKIANASVEQIIKDTSEVICKEGLNLKVPLVKEVKTHIVVATTLTKYAV